MLTKPTIYTREFVAQEVGKMLEEVTTNQGLFFIGQLFERRPYSRQRYSEWAEKFQKDDEISDTIKRIEELIETRLVEGGLTSALNPAITIFTLKNKHRWADKSQVEQSGTIEVVTRKHS